jgi:YbbR domain-containing protein
VQRLRNIARQLPTFLTAFVLALVVWIVAVTANDPSLQKDYPTAIPIEIVGQSTDLVITNPLPGTVSLTLRAPASVWTTLIDEKAPVRAIIDLSGLGEGDHTVPIQIEIGARPVELISFNPRSEDIQLEKLTSSQFDITLTTTGTSTIGYQVGTPVLSDSKATVSGAASLVSQVATVVAQIDITGKTSDFSDTVTLVALDQNGTEVKNVTISPDKVKISESVVQLGGFRNVVVKVVTTGQVAIGYRLTSISVNPPTITVYSTDPALIEALPGYVETDPINLTGLKDDLNQEVNLRLGSGITVVGNPTVNVQVSIATIENSVQYSNVLVVPIGLDPGLQAEISPARVNLLISGPTVAFNSVVATDLRVQIDLSGYQPGTYIIEPNVSINYPDLKIESIFTTTFQVTITKVPPTPTPAK